MSNAILLLLVGGLVGFGVAAIYGALQRQERQQSAHTPVQPRVVSNPPIQQNRPAVQPAKTTLKDLLPEGALGFAVVDLETTHLGVKQARVVEIAISLIDPQGRVERRWHSLVNPELAIPNSHIHGISDAMVAPAPSFSALAPTIGRLLDGRVLVAHNLRSFDRPILVNCYTRCGVGNFDPGDGIDTMPSPRQSLKKFCKAHGIELSSSDAHTASGDVQALTDVLLQLPPHLKPAAQAACFTAAAHAEGGAEAWPRQGSRDRAETAPPLEPATPHIETASTGWTSIALTLNSGDSFMATGPQSRSQNTVIKRGEAHGTSIGLHSHSHCHSQPQATAFSAEHQPGFEQPKNAGGHEPGPAGSAGG